ncbi:MAG: hypothetical protein EBX40_02435, partial [Gammaproteobacteria bacterium]|nr:hypothetical protein [Gammaproteobacteria bacterium]
FIAFVSILVVFPNLHFGRRNEQFRNFFKAFADHLTELSQCGPIEALQKTEAAVAGSLNQLNTQLEELRYEPMHLILNDEKDSKVLEECNRIYQALILVRHFYEHRGHSITTMKAAIGDWLLSYADYCRALAIGEAPKIKLEALAQQLNELHALLRTPEQINADLNGMIRTSAVISALSELVWDQENAPV